MLYKHYFGGLGSKRYPQEWPKVFPSLVSDAKKLIAAAKVKLGDASYDGTEDGGQPVLSDARIAFNGVLDDAHDAFELRGPPTFLPAKSTPKRGTDYGTDTTENDEDEDHDYDNPNDGCNTSQKPYDEVVTAILLRAAFHLQDGRAIESDGSWEDWKKGRELVLETFSGDAVYMPEYFQRLQEAELSRALTEETGKTDGWGGIVEPVEAKQDTGSDDE